MIKLTLEEFFVININVVMCDINGGYFNGGISVILNRQNSNKLFIDGQSFKYEELISSYQDGVEKANAYFASMESSDG